MEIKKTRYGIHTVEFYARNMKYDNIQQLIDGLEDADDDMYCEPRTVCINNDFYATDNIYYSKYLEQYGVMMDLNQTLSNPSGIRFAINPSTFITREYNPLTLYKPNSEATTMKPIIKIIRKQLHEVSGGLKIKKKKISLSRIDLTCDLVFDPTVDLREIIRLFRKAYRPSHFKEDYSTHKGKKIDKQYCFRIQTKHISITVYDKSYDMVRKGYRKKDSKSDQILRIEISLSHEGYKRKLGEEQIKSLSYDEILRLAYNSFPTILSSYLKKLFPCKGQYLPYEKARAIIEREISDQVKKEQMLYFLKKASSDACLNVAADACMKEFSITKKVLDRLYKDFDKLDVNVLTFKKDSKTKYLSGFRSLSV